MKVAMALACLLIPIQGYAFSWSDLWKRPDQQARSLIQEDKPSEAAKKFEDPQWRAFAHYRAGEHQAAVNVLSDINDALAHYNRGNALAQLGQYEQAISSYQSALSINPDHEDAKYNKALLEKYLEDNPPPDDKKEDKDENQEPDRDQEQESDKEIEQESDQESEQNDNEHHEQDKQKQENQQSPDESSQEIKPDDSPQGFSAQHQSHPDATPENVVDAIRDEPGGLLRQKFLRDYLRRQRQEAKNETTS